MSYCLAFPRDAQNLKAKTEGELSNFASLTKTVIMANKVKAWYKNVSDMCKSIDQKIPAISSELTADLTAQKKNFSSSWN